jgi:hypothetical protein
MAQHLARVDFRVADQGRWIIREDAGHRLQVADLAVDDAEEREDGGFVRSDRIEIAHIPLNRRIPFQRHKFDHTARLVLNRFDNQRARQFSCNRSPSSSPCRQSSGS